MKKGSGEQAQQLFLFVNKDSKSKSLSKSEGISAKEINRHAQKVRNRRLAAQKANTAQDSSNSARRIALGGWKRREGEGEGDSHGSNGISPTSPAVGQVFHPGPYDQQPTPASLSTSESSSHSSGSPPSTSPDEGPPSVQEHLKIAFPATGGGRCHDDVRRDNIDRDEEQIERGDDFNNLALRLPFRGFTPNDQIDPFNQLPVRISGPIHQVLQTALRIYPYSGNNYKLAHLPAHIRHNIRQFPIAEVVQRAVTQSHHLYSFLACISIRLQGQFKEQIPGSIPKEFQNHASHHLRKELVKSSQTGVVDKNTILDILFLAVGEIASGDYESARKHLEVAANLYHVLDLRQNLDFWISESCAHVDNQLALSTGQPPVFKQSFDPGMLLPERKAALRRELQWLLDHALDPKPYYPSPISLAVKAPPRGLKDAITDFGKNLDLRMGYMFEYALRLGLFSPLLTPIVTDIVDCVAIAKVVWLSPQAVCFDAEWLCRKARAVLRQLLVIAPENNIGPLDVLGKCMEVVRCALLIAMSHACTLIGFTTAKLNVIKLQNALAFALKYWAPALGLTVEMVPLDSRPITEVVKVQFGHILYNAMVGLFSADLPGYESTHEFFMVIILNTCKLLGISSYQGLRDHMVTFLYSPILQDKSLSQVATRLGEVWGDERVMGQR